MNANLYLIVGGLLLTTLLLSLLLALRVNKKRLQENTRLHDACSAAQQTSDALQQTIQQQAVELQRLTQQLRQQAENDPLTHIRTRHFMEQRLSQEMIRGTRYGQSLALVMIDIDNLRQINDRYGHSAGDACLQQVAHLIRDSLRWPSDLISRYGSDEFCLVLPQTDNQGALAVAERVRNFVNAATITEGTTQFQITISTGIYAIVPDRDLTVDAFIRFAEQALDLSRPASSNNSAIKATA